MPQQIPVRTIGIILASLGVALGTAAVLLWRRTAWGLTLAAVALASGVLHQVTYMVALLFQAAADVPGSVPFDPAEPLILALYVVAATSLLTGTQRAQRRDA